MSTGDLISRVYSNFRGVDFRGEEINLVRSPDSQNVWKDYRKTSSIRTRPGMELKVSFPSTVYGIFFYKGIKLVHSGKNLYTVTDGGKKTIIHSALNEAPSDAFVFNGIWYFKDGLNYLQYDGTTLKDVEGYVPTTSISKSAMTTGGSTLEDVNMLTGRRKNSFLADGTLDYVLDAKDIDTDFAPIITVNDEVWTDRYTVDYKEGVIHFTEAPVVIGTDGRDNVFIEFSKTVNDEGSTTNKYRDAILKCTLLQVFDNRVFFSGNPDYPSTVWHCSLNDPTYVSDLDYYREGMDSSKIRGMVAGNNALWVFREPSDANTNVFYHTPSMDDSYGKIYPSSHSSVTIGCTGRAINFNDDIVFFSERGMEGISGDVTTEQMAAHRSTLVDSKLIAEGGYADMILAEWEGYLLVIIGDSVYLADSRAVFTNENHIEYDWFYWKMEKQITSAKVHDGVLYLGTTDGVYTLTGTGNVESWWTTPLDKFNNPNKLKTTNKRGCVAEAEGDISVYAKVEDTEFELIGEYKEVKDYFVSRIKRKKFKDLQIKFYSQTRFSLETVTLEAWVGGYIKR